MQELLLFSVACLGPFFPEGKGCAGIDINIAGVKIQILMCIPGLNVLGAVGKCSVVFPKSKPSGCYS